MGRRYVVTTTPLLDFLIAEFFSSLCLVQALQFTIPVHSKHSMHYSIFTALFLNPWNHCPTRQKQAWGKTLLTQSLTPRSTVERIQRKSIRPPHKRSDVLIQNAYCNNFRCLENTSSASKTKVTLRSSSWSSLEPTPWRFNVCLWNSHTTPQQNWVREKWSGKCNYMRSLSCHAVTTGMTSSVSLKILLHASALSLSLWRMTGTWRTRAQAISLSHFHNKCTTVRSPCGGFK